MAAVMASAHSMSGQKLGPYRILGQLGAGGMGEVYRARDERLEREVALKLLPARSFRDPEARARLLREAKTASQLNHPNICTVYEVGEENGQAYIAMELVEGQPLSERLEGGGLPAGEVVRLGLQLAEALAHAHDRGIIHRDFKSANVVVTPEGRVKVLDFGLAKRLEPGDAEAVTRSLSLTQPGALVGTLAYMAPEQLRGRPADARSDVWALGTVLYELAVGTLPFAGTTGFEMSSAILNQPHRPLPATVPLELRAVIERCLEKEPERRYQSGGEVRAALEAIQTGTVRIPWRYRRTPRWWPAIPAALVVALLALAVFDVGGLRSRLAPAAPQVRSLAVLPLENLSGDAGQEYFADGITEALITELAKLGGLQRVIARASVMSYKRTDTPLTEIGRQLGVQALLTGSATRTDNRMHITTQLVLAATGEILWANRYERDLYDALALQNEIVASVAREIRLRLNPQEEARLAGSRRMDPEAYENYLRGMFHLNEFSPQGSREALAYLHRAVAKDPAHPLPYAGLAQGYAFLGHAFAPPHESFPRARAAALQALALDDTLPEAHATLAEVKLYYEWDWAGAEESFRRALQVNPSLAAAHAHYSWYLLLMGRTEEAFAAKRRAIEADPLKPLWRAWLAWLYFWTEQYEDAVYHAQQSLELFPGFPLGNYLLGLGLAGMGRHEEAIAAQERAVAASPFFQWGLAHAYALAGRREEARRIAEELASNPVVKDRWGIPQIYAALGEYDEAFRWLEAAFEYRVDWLPWLEWEPAFAPLRDDPRFHDFLQRMKVPRRTLQSARSN
jgi:TolB-like protein/tRNA A-37 threonylcarbamoyl transferase component Bud32